MRSISSSLLSVAILLSICASFASAQDAPRSADDRSADEQAIRAASAQLAQAFKCGDVDAVACHWTEHGEYAEHGYPTLRTREEIARAYRSFVADGAKIRVRASIDSIRFVSKNAAIEEGLFTVRKGDEPPLENRYSVLYVREEGRWLIARLEERQIAQIPAP